MRYTRPLVSIGEELLPSCYDHWLTPHRDLMQRQYPKVLTRLITLLEEQHDYAHALDYAWPLLRIDPLDEDTYLRLMRLHALKGDRAGALRTYHQCATALQRDLQDAQQLLSPIYHWFGAAVDAPDVGDARELLTDLERTPASASPRT